VILPFKSKFPAKRRIDDSVRNKIGSRLHTCLCHGDRQPKVDYVVEQISDPNTPTPKGLLKYALPTGTNKSEVAEQAFKEAIKQVNWNGVMWQGFGQPADTVNLRFSPIISYPMAVANTHGVLLSTYREDNNWRRRKRMPGHKNQSGRKGSGSGGIWTGICRNRYVARAVCQIAGDDGAGNVRQRIKIEKSHF